MIQDILKILLKQEEELQFTHFTYESALQLGVRIAKRVKNSERPVAIRIFVGDIIVFQYTMKGKESSHYLCTQKKYNVVKALNHSSMYGHLLVNELGERQDLLKEKDKYCFGCGGFPIRENGKLIGAVCISGLPDPQDHEIIVDVMEDFLQKKVQKWETNNIKN